MSALAALLHEQMHGGFASLVLFDPPVRLPGKDPEDNEPIGQYVSQSTLRRRTWFESREDYISSMAQNPVFGRVRPGVAELMAETVLRPSGGGGYELRCPVEYEAQVYQYAFGWSMQVELDKVSCPVKVIGADLTTPFSFMPSMDLSELDDLDYDFLPETRICCPWKNRSGAPPLPLHFWNATAWRNGLGRRPSGHDARANMRSRRHPRRRSSSFDLPPVVVPPAMLVWLLPGQ